MPWTELGGGSVALRRVTWNLTREQINRLFELFSIEETSSSKTLRTNKGIAVESILIPWINKNPGSIFLKEQEVAERTPTPNDTRNRRRKLKEQLIAIHENYFQHKSYKKCVTDPQAEPFLNSGEEKSSSGSESSRQLQSAQHDEENNQESEEDKHMRCIVSKDEQCWGYYGFNGCELGPMKRLKCDQEGNVTERRELDPQRFYSYENGSRVIALSTDAKVRNVDIDLNEPSVYFQFASKIFNTEYMSYLINSSEEKRLSVLEADINGKLGTEYYEVIDEEWIWKYLAANILFGVLGTKSVDSALTKRRNKPSFNKKGKETLQGSRIFAETTTNLEYCPGVGRFMTLRKWRMLQRCIRPYYESYARERERFNEVFDRFEQGVHESAVRMQSPLLSEDKSGSYSWKTNGASQILQHNARSMILQPSRDLTVDECRVRSKVHDSRVKRNPSKPIKVGATVHAICICDDGLMTGYALAWNVQERAGYMSDFVVQANESVHLLPRNFSEETYWQLVDGLRNTEDQATTEQQANGDVVSSAINISEIQLQVEGAPKNADTSSTEFKRALCEKILCMNHPRLTYNLRLQSGIVYLLTRYLGDEGYCIYSDSWFTSEILAEALLKNRNIFLTGTFKTGRVSLPVIGKNLKKLKQDDVISMRNEGNGVLATMWKDRKLVRICTTAEHGVRKAGLLKRQRHSIFAPVMLGDGEVSDEASAAESVDSDTSFAAAPIQVDVLTTDAHAAWNRFLRGVDILDLTIAVYNFNRIRRYRGIWPQLFLFDIHVGLVNSYLLARKHKLLDILEKDKQCSKDDAKAEAKKSFKYKTFLLELVKQIMQEYGDSTDLEEGVYNEDDFLGELDDQDHSNYWKIGALIKKGKKRCYERGRCARRGNRCFNVVTRKRKRKVKGEEVQSYFSGVPLARWFCSHPACMKDQKKKFFCHSPEDLKKSCLKIYHDECGYVCDTRFKSKRRKLALAIKREFIRKRQEEKSMSHKGKIKLLKRGGKVCEAYVEGIKEIEFVPPKRESKESLIRWTTRMSKEFKEEFRWPKEPIDFTKDYVRRYFPGNWYSCDCFEKFFMAVLNRETMSEQGIIRLSCNAFSFIRERKPDDIAKQYKRFFRIIEYEQVHMIVNLCSSHWALILIKVEHTHKEFTRCAVKLYDSMLWNKSYDADRRIVCAKAVWFVQAMLKYYDEIGQTTRLGRVEVSSEIVQGLPQQTNSWDCGPFTAVFSLSIMTNEREFLKQERIDLVRMKMLEATVLFDEQIESVRQSMLGENENSDDEIEIIECFDELVGQTISN